MARSIFSKLLLVSISLLLVGWSGLPGFQDSRPPPPDDACRGGKCPEKKPSTYRAFPVQPQTSEDLYGYSSDDSYSTSSWAGAWTEASSGGTQVFFGGEEDDDVLSLPVDLPFPFEFYERIYNKVYISSNGLIGFDASQDLNYVSYTHYPIPHDYVPQTFIAPYWTDLEYVSAFYVSGTDARGSFFAVEWFECAYYSQPTTELTFEVKLYESGDIVFLYDQLTNAPLEKSIGMEDPHGVDGLQYLYNYAGPNEDQAILITRPSEDRRSKIVPAYQSGLNLNGLSEFRLAVWNTGDLTPDPADAFDLECTPSDLDWQVELFSENGLTALGECDASPLPDTDELAPGEAYTITMRVSAPSDVSVGEAITVTLKAISNKDPNKESKSVAVSAVPTSFAHTFRNGKLDQSAGVNIELISPRYRWEMLVNDHYTGASYMLSSMSENNLLGIWENNAGASVTNLSYMAVNPVGANHFNSIRPLTTNAAGRDGFPAAALAPDGRIGVAWVRTETNFLTGTYHQNIYLGVLNAQASQLIVPPVSVTEDSNAYPPSQLFAYREVRIAATGDNRFHLSWIKKNVGSFTSEEIAHAVYNTNGVQIKAPQLVTTPSQGVDYDSSSLIAYNDGAQERVLLLGNRRDDPQNPTYKSVFYVLDSNGAVLGPEADFYPQRSSDMDGIQMTSGDIAVAWENLDTLQVNYVVLDQALSLPPAPTDLANPDDSVGHREAGRVSVTRDLAGRAILTWIDESFNERLYYALINGNGAAGILTKPVILRQLMAGIETTLETRAVYGNAEYQPVWRITLPIIRR